MIVVSQQDTCDSSPCSLFGFVIRQAFFSGIICPGDPSSAPMRPAGLLVRIIRVGRFAGAHETMSGALGPAPS